FPTTVEIDDRVVDRLVRRAVEVVAADLLDHVGDRVLGQQHAAQHAHLGGDVLRRGAVKAGAGPRIARLELLDRHPHLLLPRARTRRRARTTLRRPPPVLLPTTDTPGDARPDTPSCRA